MSIILGIVLYQSAFRYLDELIDSINGQNTKCFKVLFINDNIDEKMIGEKIRKLNVENDILHFEEPLSPIELRIKLIQESKHRNADLLIMCDADDLLSEDRVSKVTEYSIQNKEFSFFYNSIYSFSDKQMLPDMPLRIESIEDIIDYNFLGLSNTALRVSDISDNEIMDLHNCKQLVFDWYLYTILLLNDFKGLYVPGVKTYYRIHEDNIVGNQDNNPQKIDYEVSVKKIHYQSLMNKNIGIKERYEKYRDGKYLVKSGSEMVNWWGYTRAL